MLEGSQSGCINHPAVPAAIHCKQCGQPACGHCEVTAPQGHFCSEKCRDQYVEFVTKAEALEAGRKHFPKYRIGPWIRKAVILLILLGSIGYVASIMYVPFLSPLVYKLRNLVGF